MLAPVEIEDFSGGLDLVSSLNQIAPGYTPNAMNFRIAEYGGIEKVLGYSAFSDLGSGVEAHELFNFDKRDGSLTRLIAASASKWQSIESDGTATDRRTGMTTTTNTTFVSYEDVLYGLDPENIMGSWTGSADATHAAGVDTGPSKGIILGIWGDRMWVAKATSGKLGLDIQFSDLGNFTSTGAWPTDNNFSLGGTSNTDKIVGGVPTADGLVVFTENATHIIYDPDTGANRLVDAEHGCSSRKSLALVDGMIYGVNPEGVFRTNGAFPLEIVSRRISPLFLNERPNLSAAAGVRWFNSYLVSYRRSGAYNNLTLDVTPNMSREEGAPPIMANEYRASCWASSDVAGSEKRMYFIDAGNTRYVRRAFDGGAFLTTASPGVAANIACYYELPPMNFGSESQLKRLHKVRIVGRGALLLGVKKDYVHTVRDTASLGFPASGGGEWDNDDWDEFEWAGYELSEGWIRIQLRARRIAMRISETSQEVSPTREALNSSPSSNLGGAGVYLIQPFISISSRIR